MSETREPVKKVRNAVLYSDGTIRVDNVRASYPHLLKPYAGNNDEGGGGEPKYSLVALLPKDTHAAAKALIEARINEILKENKLKALPDDRLCLRDGDKSGKAENEGMWTLSARESRAPVLRSPSKGVIRPGDTVRVAGRDVKAEDLFYGGCWVNAIFRFWYQNNKYGKRVNGGLVAVQFVRDGEAFGQGRISEDAIDDSFEALEDDESGFEDADENEDEYAGL